MHPAEARLLLASGMNSLRPYAVVRGADEVASAVALRLYAAGYAVLLVDATAFAITRRGQFFANTMFNRAVALDGVACRRVDSAATWTRYGAHDIALTAQALEQVLAELSPEVLVDARMKKHAVAENQRGLAPLVVGLGPDFIAGGNADFAVEGEVVAHSGDRPVAAPKSGMRRGLVRDGVEVAPGTKSVDVVPKDGKVFGAGERPGRIAAGVVNALRRRLGLLPLARAAIAGVLRNAEAGELPLFAATLGFDRLEFNALVETLQPGARLSMPDLGEGYALCAVREPDLFEPLARMLWEQRAPDLAERPTRWLAHAVAAASFGCRHLWQDLGLSGRVETTALLHLHFPALVARNTDDLKWKRYLFLALGERLGSNDLKPPGCAGCDSYSTCYSSAPHIPSGLPSGHRHPPRPA